MTADRSNSRAVTAREEGSVLLLVILIMTLISVLVLSWAQEWRTELKLASNFAEAHKCQRLAEAGIYYALGKMVTAKTAETSGMNPFSPQARGDSGALWNGDQQPHELELPDGIVVVRIGDEGGKINLNAAAEPLLYSFFTVLGLPEPQVRIMVDSIQDWRVKGSNPRLYGAKSDYYLNLNPPYVAKNGRFETVEELAWVRGFEASPLIPQLSRWLTVQGTGGGININTAPLEVLLAMGFPRETAMTIMATRQSMPLQNFQGFAPTGANPALGQSVQMAFRSSPFFTITATGMVKKNSSRQTMRATVRLDTNQRVPWMITSWYSGFPG